MRTYRVRGNVVSALPALLALAVISFATTARAQSAAPRVIGSSESDTGPLPQPVLNMTLPNGVKAGQLLLAVVAIQGSNPGVNPWATILLPAGGWTEIAPLPRNCSGDFAMSVSYRIAQATDTPATSFRWGFLSGGFLAPELSSGGIVSIANVSTTVPVSQINALCTTNSTQVTGQSATTSNDNSLDLLVFGITGDNFLSTPKGYSQPFQHIVSGIGPDLAVDTKLIPIANTNTGSQISTAGSAGDNMGFQIILNRSHAGLGG